MATTLPVAAAVYPYARPEDYLLCLATGLGTDVQAGLRCWSRVDRMKTVDTLSLIQVNSNLHRIDRLEAW